MNAKGDKNGSEGKQELRVFAGDYLNRQRKEKEKEYYDNGELKYEGEYINGKRNGSGKEYDEDGELIFEGEYLDGKRNGNGKEYDKGKLCSRFRDVILGIDYFGELYQKIKEITDFTENDMKNSEIFNDQEKFPSVIRLAVAYSKNNIDKDIYTKVFDH